MQANLKDKKNGREADHFLDERFQKWLSEAKATPKGLDDLLEDWRRLTKQLLEENEQEKRIRYFEQSVAQLLQCCFPTRTKSEEIKIELWKGHSYEMFGAWDKALSAYQRVIELSDSEEFTSQKANAHRWRGHIQTMQNRFAEALKSHAEGLRLTRDCGDKKGEAQSHNGLALFYFEKGALGEAVSHWGKALKLAKAINETKLIAQVDNNLGMVANVEGDWEKSLAHYGESLRHFEKIGDARGLARTYHNIAKTYADTARWQEAGMHYEKSYKLAKEIGDVHTQANIKLNRAELYIAIGDSYLAEALCRRALQTYLQLKDHLGEADVFKLLGVICTGKREWSTARAYFEKSIGLTRKFKSPLCEAEAHLEYGRMWKKKGYDRSAQKQYALALSSFTQVKAHKQIEKVEQEMRITRTHTSEKTLA